MTDYEEPIKQICVAMHFDCKLLAEYDSMLIHNALVNAFAMFKQTDHQ